MTDRTPAIRNVVGGELFAAVAAIGYGSAYVATAIALHSFAPLPVAVYRSLIAALALGVLNAVLFSRGRATGRPARSGSGARPDLAHRAPRLLLIAILGGPLFLASMNLAVAHVGAAIAAFVAGLYAVIAAVIAPALLPERLAPRALAGFVVALVGTALLAELNPASTDVAGMAWGLAAAVAFSLFLVLSRRWSEPNGLDGPTIALATMGTAAAVLAALVLLTDPASLVPTAVSGEAVAAILWLALVAAAGPLLAVASVRLVPAARTAAFLLFNPITATILAALLLGERPSALQVAGGLLVLAGIAAATVPIPGRRPVPIG